MVTLDSFISTLSSASPTPGGGGASALIGAVSAALCSMVANLTSGKKKYAAYQTDIERILNASQMQAQTLLSYIDKDARAFAPLSAAYGIPKDDPGRETTLEAALLCAAEVPLSLMYELENTVSLLEELCEKGSRLAISDVGVAAAACSCALKGAVMNIYINTKLMKNREKAAKMNHEASVLLNSLTKRCDIVYQNVVDSIQ